MSTSASATVPATPPSVLSEIEMFARIARAGYAAQNDAEAAKRDLAKEILHELRKEVAELERDAWKFERTDFEDHR
jgi:hypothetical protein